MQFKDKKKIYFIFYIYTCLICILCFCFFYYLKLSLFLGFIIGSMISHLSFETRESIVNYSLNTANKNKAFFLTTISWFIFLTIIILLTILFLLINTYSKNYFNIKKLDIGLYPINIISFIFGLSSFRLAIYFYYVLKKIKWKEA